MKLSELCEVNLLFKGFEMVIGLNHLKESFESLSCDLIKIPYPYVFLNVALTIRFSRERTFVSYNPFRICDSTLWIAFEDRC